MVVLQLVQQQGQVEQPEQLALLLQELELWELYEPFSSRDGDDDASHPHFHYCYHYLMNDVSSCDGGAFSSCGVCASSFQSFIQ